MDESVGWLLQVSLTLFAFRGSARLLEGVNAKSVRLSCTADSSTAKTGNSCTQLATIKTWLVFTVVAPYYRLL